MNPEISRRAFLNIVSPLIFTPFIPRETLSKRGSQEFSPPTENSIERYGTLLQIDTINSQFIFSNTDGSNPSMTPWVTEEELAACKIEGCRPQVYVSYPSWSPSGEYAVAVRTLAFSDQSDHLSYEFDSERHFLVFNRQGQIIQKTRVPLDEESRSYVYPQFARTVKWNQNEDSVLWTSDTDLYQYNFQTTENVPLTQDASTISSSPSVSPDGQLLAYAHMEYGHQCTVFVRTKDANGNFLGHQTPVFRGVTGPFDPSLRLMWLPNNKELVFSFPEQIAGYQGFDAFNTVVKKVSKEGDVKNLVNVDGDGTFDEKFDLSEDGTRLAINATKYRLSDNQMVFPEGGVIPILDIESQQIVQYVTLPKEQEGEITQRPTLKSARWINHDQALGCELWYNDRAAVVDLNGTYIAQPFPVGFSQIIWSSTRQ